MKVQVRDQFVHDELASPMHTHLEDRCINCEYIKPIIATITFDQRTGPICRDCFILYKK